MSRLKDLTGQTFGRLLVIKRAGSDKWGRAKWLCRCGCGKESVIYSGNIVNGHSKSCGCLQKEHFKWAGDNVGYDAAHRWLTKNKPKPSVCEMCREHQPAELSFNHKVGNWTRNIEDYQWLCTSCHKLKDAGNKTKPLTKARVHRIREFYKVGAGTHKKLGELFKVSKATITKIINHKGIYANEGC